MCSTCIRVIFVCSEFPTTQRTKKMACIPARNRNVFSYRASLPHTISVEIPIGKANILTFHQKTLNPRPASRNSIGKSRNSPFKRYEPVVRRASDQRTITPRRIFTSGRMHAIGYSAGEFTFSLAAYRIIRFSFFSFFFFRNAREQHAHAVPRFARIEA